MREPKSWLSRPFYPFLLGAYPVLAVFAFNIEEVLVLDLVRPLGVAVVVVSGTLWIFQRLLGNRHQSALLAALALVLVASYGHVYPLLKPLRLLGEPVGRHRYLLPALALIVVATTVLLRRRRISGRTTQVLNAAALVLVMLPGLQIGVSLGQFAQSHRSDDSQSSVEGLSLPASQRPDIYYIVLDAYTGASVLRDFYGFDNRPFLAELEARGYYVAGCSQSNYARTSLSLASSLNMAYLEAFFPQDETLGISEYIRKNAVRTLLEDSGYLVVAIDSGYPSTRWTDADAFLELTSTSVLQSSLLGGLSEFEILLLRTTAAASLLEAGAGGWMARLVEQAPRVERYTEIVGILSVLEQAVALPGPKLVFAHLRTPHEPYVFAADGTFLPDQPAHHPGYPDQVQHLNSRLLPILDRILATEGPTPIVILQGDHGSPEFRTDARRMSIFYATLLPGAQAGDLYPTITPVNTFRIVFHRVFQRDLDPLPDVSFLSLPGEDLDFEVVPALDGCGEGTFEGVSR